MRSIPLYRFTVVVLTVLLGVAVYATTKADMAYRALLKESIGNRTALALNERTAFADAAQARFKELDQVFQKSVAEACAMEGIAIEECAFDPKTKWVLKQVKPAKTAPPVKK